MGASVSVQTVVNNINDKIRTRLEQQASASSTAVCDITIGSLIIKKNLGCSVSVRNLCSAQSDAQIDAILSAVTDVYNNLSDEQKSYVPGLLTASLNIQTTVNTAIKDFETYVKQTCNADAIIHNKIKVQSIVMDECASPPGATTHIDFTNTGTAKGNCGVKAVLDVIAKASTNEASRQYSNIPTPYMYIAIAVIAIAMIFLYYAKHMLFTSTQDKIKLILASKPDVHWTTYLDTFYTYSPSILSTN
ncbi:IMV myristylated membrane protein [Sea otter poxvirus]|uniref:IMV myristylated membrane protein n=1 Tax=Sea otter poxvirus TaxID=1416741 RepID=A0A2U9QHN0_9POXV|nr:IMV myristylated membrane protein [Sea otter poxvirus]AWU47105.1 IMV myristylated membrane protein [Sea otter poxvirus]